MEQKFRLTNILLLVFLVFNGLSGILGGFMLIKDPSGFSLYMNIEWLQSTPFNNFLIPGIVLFTFNGLGNSFGAIAALLKKPYTAFLAIALGLIMMLWIIAQVAWIGYKNFLQPLYFTTGLLQLLIGTVFMRLNK